MTRVLARRTEAGWEPADDAAVEEFNRVRVGKVAYVEIKAARNPKQHRMLFALLKMLVDAGCFPTIDAALIAVKFATGMVDSVIIDPRTGATQLIPKSVSYANMTQGEFAPWFDAVIREVSQRWLPGVPDDYIRSEIETMISGGY